MSTKKGKTKGPKICKNCGRYSTKTKKECSGVRDETCNGETIWYIPDDWTEFNRTTKGKTNVEALDENLMQVYEEERRRRIEKDQGSGHGTTKEQKKAARVAANEEKKAARAAVNEEKKAARAATRAQRKAARAQPTTVADMDTAASSQSEQEERREQHNLNLNIIKTNNELTKLHNKLEKIRETSKKNNEKLEELQARQTEEPDNADLLEKIGKQMQFQVKLEGKFSETLEKISYIKRYGVVDLDKELGKEETKEGGRKTRRKTKHKRKRKTKHKRRRKTKHKRRRKTKRKTKHKRRRKNAKTRKK